MSRALLCHRASKSSLTPTTASRLRGSCLSKQEKRDPEPQWAGEEVAEEAAEGASAEEVSAEEVEEAVDPSEETEEVLGEDSEAEAKSIISK